MKVLATPGRSASRLRTLPATLGAAVLTVVLAAAPALASGPVGGTGPGGSMGGGGTGCSGVDCYADVWQYIKLTGNAVGAGGGNGQAEPMPPPPCYMESMFSGPELYTLWKEGGPGFPFLRWLGSIKKLKGSNAGYWWERVTNIGVGGSCNLPLLAWVTNGAAPPLPAVPQIDLAIYAYDHMKLPSPQLKLNPSNNRGYVSLPSYVWAALPFRVGRVTATLGGESATVTAPAGNLSLSVGQTGSATVYSSGCTTYGSTAPDPPQNAGPGTTPDCGVTFTAPGYGNTVYGHIAWDPTSGGRQFPMINVVGEYAVTVFEIQSLSN
jgi:hypothetical protein